MYLPRRASTASIDFSLMTGPEDDLGGGQGAHAYTSSIRARAGCSMRTMSALSRSTTLSESARITSTVGRLRADSSSFSSRPGATTRTRPVGLERAEHAGEVAGLDRLEPERVDHPDRLVAELGGQRAAQREPLHLARQALLVASAGAARRRRRRRGSAARSASPGGRGRCPSGGTACLPPPRTSPRVFVSCVPMRRPASWAVTTWWRTAAFTGAANSVVGELDAADGLAGPVVEGGLRHRQAFFTRMSAPRAPGQACP